MTWRVLTGLSLLWLSLTRGGPDRGGGGTGVRGPQPASTSPPVLLQFPDLPRKRPGSENACQQQSADNV